VSTQNFLYLYMSMRGAVRVPAFFFGLALWSCGAQEPASVVESAPAADGAGVAQAPVAVLSYGSAATGVAPFVGVLDASGSIDPDGDSSQLQYRWDFVGDGTWLTSFSPLAQIAYSYTAPGTYRPRVEVRDADGLTSIAQAQLPLVIQGTGTDGPANGGPFIPGDANDGADGSDNQPPPQLPIDDEQQPAPPVTTPPTDNTDDTSTSGDNQSGDNQSGDNQSGDDGEAQGSNPTPVEADLDVDTNRDGVVDAADELGEDTWSSASGAIFTGNLDDDDQDGVRDGLDDFINGYDDFDDMVEIVVRSMDGLMLGHSVEIEVWPMEARPYVRIFRQRADGYVVSWHETEQSATVLPHADLQNGDVSLWMEGVVGRYPGFDGGVELSMVVRFDDQEVSRDTVMLKGAPTVFPNNTQDVERVYVMRLRAQTSQGFDPSNNQAFRSALQNHLPLGIDLYNVAAGPYEFDRWLQDSMQTGYVRGGPASAMPLRQSYLQTSRGTGGLQALLPDRLLGPELGYVAPGGSPTSHNFGGNLEVAPPHAGYPLGRLVAGGGDGGTLYGYNNSDGMNANQSAYLNAQGVQGPVVEVSSEWLAVGHVDEIFVFLADKSTASDQDWKIAIASPILAKQYLLQAANDGHGAKLIFAGRSTQTTVEDLLFDDTLMEYNELAQARIDSVRQDLKIHLNLTDADFIEVPVLFEFEVYDGTDMAIALNPGVQNLVVTNDVLFVPDPEGPTIGGVDWWQWGTRTPLENLGYTVEFVDVFNSYHLLMGEAHCGTNTQRKPLDLAWWEVE
jgi:protein-arginine deiminase